MVGGLTLYILSLEQQLSAELNRVNFDKLMVEQPYEYKSIFLNKIRPDSTNPRFLPVVIIPNQDAYQVATKKITKSQLIARYDAENKVVIGKACIVNCFKYNSPDWKKANKTIESITELASNIAVSEIIQVPTIYPTEDGGYQILTGHRRFFAMLYANGLDSAAHFKLYLSRPALPKTKQFQENASREDLPQYGKLQAFKDAMLEIETLSSMRQRQEGKVLTVKECASILGVSMGAFDNYNVLTRYAAVLDAYHHGYAQPFIKMKKMVLSIENSYKRKHNITALNIDHKTAINQLIKKAILKESDTKPKQNPKTYRIAPITSVDVLKTLLSVNVFELELGIDWNSMDWQDNRQVNDAIAAVVSYIEMKNSA